MEKSSFISEDDFVKWTRRVTPQAGDVVFSYETKIGEASIIPEGLRCCLGRRMGLLRAKQDKVLPQYLLYAYLSPTFQDVIREKRSTVVLLIVFQSERCLLSRYNYLIYIHKKK